MNASKIAALFFLGLATSLTPAFAQPPVKRAKLEIKPYVAPRIEAEPELSASDTAVVQIPNTEEAIVVFRPGPGAPMLGSAVPGARLPVRGMWDAPNNRRCEGKRWYAIAPFGWVCSDWVRKTDEPASTESILKVAPDKILPYDYVMIGAKTEEESFPLWASVEDLKGDVAPAFKLRKGDTVAVKPDPPLKWKGETYLVAEDGRVFAAKPSFPLKGVSTWTGAVLDGTMPLPFGWVTPNTAKVYDGPDATAKVVDQVARREALAILEDAGLGSKRRVRIGDSRWLRASDLNEVRALARPAGATANDRFIAVDLGEQVLVAYDKDRPVFATLVSSGRAFPTPRGNYPIWGKVSQITMKSQPYEDKTYYVDRVPWVLFFQAHNAIHGAYWHDRFGVSKSHGCVNVAPRDARWLFEWMTPALPAAWSGLRTPNLLEGVTVHVFDSSKRKPFEQERNMGPPDREEEKMKLEEADARRLAEAAAVPLTPAIPALTFPSFPNPPVAPTPPPLLRAPQ